jgi:phage-related protein
LDTQRLAQQANELVVPDLICRADSVTVCATKEILEDKRNKRLEPISLGTIAAKGNRLPHEAGALTDAGGAARPGWDSTPAVQTKTACLKYYHNIVILEPHGQHMPKTRVIFFREDMRKAPVYDWLSDLRRTNAKAWVNCRVKIEMLAQHGHELRRPAADFLRDGIYELRAKQGRVQYRILYFFHGRNVAILAHSLAKEDKVPVIDIERAISRMKLFMMNPKEHTYESED